MKRFVFVFFSILVIFSFNVNAYAQSNLSITYDEWINYIDDVENDNNAVSQALRILGFVASDVKFALKVPTATIKDILNIPSDMTIKDYIKSKTSKSDDDKPVLDTDLHSGLKEVANYYIEEVQGYCYSYPTDYSAVSFYSIEQFISGQSIINGHQNNIVVVIRSNDGRSCIGTFNLTAHPYLVFVKRTTTAGGIKLCHIYDAELQAYPTTWDGFYKWNNTTKEWESFSDVAYNRNTNINVAFVNNAKTPDYPNESTLVNFTNTPFRYFDSLADVTNDEVVYQPYYYNNRTWSNFDNSTGDYTIDNSNYNPITYGDVTNYINSFNTENGYIPSAEDIFKYIKDTDDDNNSGGGSGGSGGSGSDDDDGGSIFDWLKSLGKVLGDLIKGVGEFITEIIAGLVSALNDLMSSLSGLITDTLGSLTSVFSSIIDFVYSGLPDSVKGIMMLALTVSLLITVIQLIRK